MESEFVEKSSFYLVKLLPHEAGLYIKNNKYSINPNKKEFLCLYKNYLDSLTN